MVRVKIAAGLLALAFLVVLRLATGMIAISAIPAAEAASPTHTAPADARRRRCFMTQSLTGQELHSIVPSALGAGKRHQ